MYISIISSKLYKYRLCFLHYLHNTHKILYANITAIIITTQRVNFKRVGGCLKREIENHRAEETRARFWIVSEMSSGSSRLSFRRTGWKFRKQADVGLSLSA